MFGGHFLHGFFVLDPSVYNKVWIRTFTQLFHPEQGSIGGGIGPVLGSLLQDFKSLTLFLRFEGSFPRRRRWYRIKQLRPWVVDLGSSVRFGYVQRLALGCWTAVMPNLLGWVSQIPHRWLSKVERFIGYKDGKVFESII